MSEFIVGVREVHVQFYRVEAETPADAIAEVRNGGGQIVDGALEYSHTLDSDTWSVEGADTAAQAPALRCDSRLVTDASGMRQVLERIVRDWRLAEGESCPPEDHTPYRLTVTEDSRSGQVYIDAVAAHERTVMQLSVIVEIDQGVPCLHILARSDGGDRQLHIYADGGVLYITPDDPSERLVRASPCRFTYNSRDGLRLG